MTLNFSVGRVEQVMWVETPRLPPNTKAMR